MTRVASAATESHLLNVAEYGTASQMEKTVRLIKQGMALEDPDRLRAMVERCECDWARRLGSPTGLVTTTACWCSAHGSCRMTVLAW